MKIYISKPRNHWISPYTIIDYLFFWTDWSKCGRTKNFIPDTEYIPQPNWVKKVVPYLNPISEIIKSILNFVHPEINYVKVDYWDSWCFESTLSPIILLLLKQLKENKHGHGWIADVDVPEEIRSTASGARDGLTNEHDWDNHSAARYDYVLDEMIFAFSCLVDDSWEKEFESGEIDHTWFNVENSIYKQLGQGPNHTYKCDYEGKRVVEKRIDNGLRLFGTYFRTLWD